MKHYCRKRIDIENEIIGEQLSSGMRLMLEVLLDIRVNASKIISELQILNGKNDEKDISYHNEEEEFN